MFLSWGRLELKNAWIFKPGTDKPGIYRKFCILLSLSKKSKWLIMAFWASLKINNLQVIDNLKMANFRVFRQPRSISTGFPVIEKVSI
jgi:hypothetical protein